MNQLGLVVIKSRGRPKRNYFFLKLGTLNLASESALDRAQWLEKIHAAIPKQVGHYGFLFFSFFLFQIMASYRCCILTMILKTLHV